MDRIPPVPAVTRDALIETYFEDNEEVQRDAKKYKDNKDCWVRVYLGEHETLDREGDCYDELRNFPMRLNMMQYLNLDTSILAQEMALGLPSCSGRLE